MAADFPRRAAMPSSGCDAGECLGALVSSVDPDSPADDAGFYPGCRIVAVDGMPVRDSIDWRWLTADDEIELSYIDAQGDSGTVLLCRDEGESWGITFDGVVFDGVKRCRNACTFCFMRQLPSGLRPSLSLRDDDFRLSFLSGTFVTMTNVTPEDERRICEQRISPLRVSLHAVDADTRRRLIGKHAARGLGVIERLLASGIEMHVQIVLVPHVNDGDVLRQTLAWAYEHPGILNVGIVPLGYTRHQSVFSESFNDARASLRVLSMLEPFQLRACEERGCAWVYAADEFYRNAYGDSLIDRIPPASFYGDFGMFEDGIGIVRSYIDDMRAASESKTIDAFALACEQAGVSCRMIVGRAMEPLLDQLVSQYALDRVFAPLYVDNDFFGGNVDVTGLLVGADVARALQDDACDALLRGTSIVYALPDVVLNDDGLFLDDLTVEDVQRASGASIRVVSCNPSEFFSELASHVSRMRP